MIAPENFIQQAAGMRRLIDLRGDSLMEAALASLINKGDLGRHLKKSNKIYHQRRDLFCGLLDKYLGNIIQFRKPAGGMAIWAQVAKKYPLPALAAKAQGMGLFMSEGNNYNTGPVNYNSLRMGFASLNEEEIKEVVSLLTKALTR
jgi:GntR family transcriptional regulator/MocR family aminotransferase